MPHVSPPVTVAPAHGRTGLTAFIRLPHLLYTGNPHWTPPLDTAARALIDPASRHPFHDTATVQPFLARRGRRVTGRIAAVDDPRQPQGGFGFFECERETETAVALVAAASDWLRARGRTAVLGPLNPSTNRECGLLVDGFETPPVLLMPYNPDYYPPLLEACGLKPAKDLYSWTIDLNAPVPERILRLQRHTLERRDCVLRPLDIRRLDEEAALLCRMYNAAWRDNWGFVPMTEAEFRHTVREVRPLLGRSVARVVEVDGVPVAFGVTLPDIAPALRKARGRLWRYGLPLGLVELTRVLRRPERGRALLFGVLSEHRGKGFDVLLRAAVLELARELGMRTLDLSWTLEDNSAVNKGTAAMGGRRSVTHRLYEKEL